MARKKKGDGAEDGAAPAKKGNLVPALVLAVGLLGGGYLMGGQGASAPAGAVAGTTTTTVAEGAVVALDPITLNLADGRFLKVALAIQLAEAGAAGGHGGGAEEDPAAAMAKALDEAIDVLGGRTYAELAAPGGRAAAKEELSHRVQERYHGEVLDVYFTEFVMQ